MYATFGDMLAEKFGARRTVAVLQDGLITTRRFDPSHPFSPDLEGTAFAQAYASRWGFLPSEVKGGMREHSLPDASEIEAAAHHASNPFELLDNARYQVTAQDLTDLDLVTADGRQPVYWAQLDALVARFGPQAGPFRTTPPSAPPAPPPPPNPVAPPPAVTPVAQRVDELKAAARPFLEVVAFQSSAPTDEEEAQTVVALQDSLAHFLKPAILVYRAAMRFLEAGGAR